MPIARAMHETLYNNPLIAAHIRTVEKLGVENGDAFRPANSGRQVYESKGFSRTSSMDDGRPNVAVGSAVMTVRTREVGKAWAKRSLGIALALCMSLTVIGDLTVRAAAEPWSGILDPSRAIDWSHAGIPGGIPSRATICASLDPSSTASQIDAAIAACPPDQVVFLTAGTFTLSAGLNMKSDVTLRGAGAARTKLVFTGTTQCDRGPSPYPVICFKGSFSWAGGVENSADWTTGYAKGTTVITLSNTANLRAGESFLILDQVDDATDGGDIYNCGIANACVSQGSDGMRTAPGGYRNQRQIVKVAAIAGSQVTITPGIYMPNWRATQGPQAWWPTTVLRRAGIENMTIQPVDGGGGINIQNAMECWITGVRSVKVAPPGGPGGGRNHVWLTMTRGNEIRSNYFYGSGGQSQSYGIEWYPGSDNLVENNIFQHVTSPMLVGTGSGDVLTYNFAIDDLYTPGGGGWMQPTYASHNGGDAMLLIEGNDGLGAGTDNIHGTHHFLTFFRNHFYGDPNKTANSATMHLWAYSRFFNIIGNVLGRPIYYTTYQTDLGTDNVDIYSFGQPDLGLSGDPRTRETAMRWGNYDTVSATSRFDAAEVPSGLTNFGNPVPANQVLPPSLYLSIRPSWWGSVPWPAIGPDVAGGNIPGYGGHAHQIPARLCYESATIDPAYGSSNVRIFDPAACYVTASPPSGTTPGWWPETLFGIGTGVLLVGVVSAIALFLIFAVWRSRSRRSEQEGENEASSTGPEDRRD
ncbi:MAG TPA: hypothetical protein VNP71_05750 [Thermoplasmata archaeon]|nr:hypothetical protein [Thermoplasmata archaeon]